MSKRKAPLSEDNPNNDFCEFLTELANYERNVNRNIHKYNAYRKAASSLAAHKVRITSGKEARKLEGVGEKVAEKIDEFLKTGTLQKLDKIRKDGTNESINLFTRVSGIGPVKAKELVDSGLTTLDDLRKNLDKLTHHQQIGLRYFEDFEKRIPREEISLIETIIKNSVMEMDAKYLTTVCGSYRRGLPSSGDVDVLLTHPDYNSTDSGKAGKSKAAKLLSRIVTLLEEKKLITETISHGDVKFMVFLASLCKLPVRRIFLSTLTTLTRLHKREVCSVDCALKIQQGLAEFGVFTAEEALLASNFIDKSAQVIADIRHVERITDPYAFQAVAVVKSTYGGTLSSLRGSNFCHPGFAPGGLWTDSVLKHFERFVVTTPCEDNNMSLVEQEIKALSSFFNSACRPGPWVQEDMFDARLKLNYSNLCSLCDSPKTCAYASHETGSHRAALTCLTHRGGDVAYVALRYVRQYFGLEPGFSAMANPNEFKLLCPDGSTDSIIDPSPCSWVNQPWNSVLARRDIAMLLQPLLLSWLSPSVEARDPWQQALSALIIETDHNINSVTSLLSNFVRQGGETRQACRGSVKWCTISGIETRKCEWLRAAVQTHGIQPSLDCVTASNEWECWANIRDGIANVVTVDTEYGYITRRSYNMSPVVYLDSGVNGQYQILAIVSSSNKMIKSWSNIRQKKACFPEFGGLAWSATVATLLEQHQLAKICPYGQAMASYLGGACAPGAKDTDHTRGSGVVPAKLCSLCSSQPNGSDSCSTTQNSVFYGDLGALRCLTSGFGDIAFVDYRQLTGSDGKLAGDIEPSSYRVLCRNGSLAHTVGLNVDNDCALAYLRMITLLAGSDGKLAGDIEPSSYRVLCRNGSLAHTVGLNVDNDCALAHGIGSEVMAHAGRSSVRDLELRELLLELDQWFGSTSPSKMDSVFHMYSEFQDTKDLLFKDSSRGIILPNDPGYSYVNSYKQLQDVNSVCLKNRNSGVPVIPSIILFVAIFICPFIL
ncbi:transferrin-like isoform X2 [Macrosteles quadrilineatus]|uniref:transferrin-like isoform X2 n=1 Tax=Macrosteles quadrilineatus TaxID=74068 RepID=UPI0023E0F938|nr:transferrin-like isoform X2 [Macrosteles quadrilineatus]